VIICSCCNPPRVMGEIRVGHSGMLMKPANGIAVPYNFPTQPIDVDEAEVTTDGVAQLEERGYTYKDWPAARQWWWHQPDGNPIVGIIEL